MHYLGRALTARSRGGAAEHIAQLLAGGWKRIEIARATELSPALVTQSSRPRNGLNASTAEKNLALGAPASVARD